MAVFVAVADTGGISSAAALLGYAQSSASAQMKALEVELGARLIERTAAGSRLTAAGERLLPHAREALILDDRIRRAVLGATSDLRVGALESLAAEWLPDILTARQLGAGKRGPAMPVSLSVERRGALADRLRDGQLDLAFVFDNGVPAVGPSERVDEEAVVLVAAPDHALAQSPSVSHDDLLRTEFLVAERGCTAEMLVDRLGRDLTGHAPVAMVTGSLAALRRLAANGHGVALMPYLSVSADLESGTLVRLRTAFPLAPIGIEARWRADAGPSVGQQVLSLITLARRNTLRARLPQAQLG